MIGVAQFRGKSRLSRFIQWQTRSPWSHSAFIEIGTRRIFEAWQGIGVNGWHSANLYHTPGTVVEVFAMENPLGEDAERNLRLWLLTQRGMGYDWRNVVRFLSRRAALPRNRWFCSSLVFAGFANVGRPLLERIAANHVSPGILGLSPLLFKVDEFRTGPEVSSPSLAAQASWQGEPISVAPDATAPARAANGPVARRVFGRPETRAGGRSPFCKGVASFCTSTAQGGLPLCVG